MLEWFLNLFSPYRDLNLRVGELLKSLRDASEARARAEDEATYWRDKVDAVEDELTESHKRELEVREMMTDFIAQQRWGMSIFHRGPQLPADPPETAPIPTRRVQARHLVNQKNRERLQALIDKG